MPILTRREAEKGMPFLSRYGIPLLSQCHKEKSQEPVQKIIFYYIKNYKVYPYIFLAAFVLLKHVGGILRFFLEFGWGDEYVVYHSFPTPLPISNLIGEKGSCVTGQNLSTIHS